jgi:hypothetical protein
VEGTCEPGATVVLLDPGGGGTRLARSDEQGRFRFAGLRPGRYTLSAPAARWSSGSGGVEVEVRGGATATVQIPKGARP